MDDLDKEARFEKQKAILKRLNERGKGFRWNDNHAMYPRKPALKPYDRQRLIEEVNHHINDIDDL